MRFPGIPLRQRVEARIAKGADGCWCWAGPIQNKGYGYVSEKLPTGEWVKRLVHRLMFVWYVGEIPAGMELDHLCRNRRCVNPSHLEPVTRRENIRRGIGPSVTVARIKSRTTCPAGHPYDEANTYERKHGWRACRTCAKDRARKKRSTAEGRLLTNTIARKYRERRRLNASKNY